MSETYIFNAHNIKSEEINSKTLMIWPRSNSETDRIDIMDLFDGNQLAAYNFPFSAKTQEKVESTAATGWFIPGLLTDSIIIIDGIEYIPMAEATLEEGFVAAINAIESCPVSASVSGSKVILTAKEAGESGNLITIGYKAEPNPNDGSYSSGPTLSGGVDGGLRVSVSAGTIYLPHNEVVIIPQKEDLIIPDDGNRYYVLLNVVRNSDGTISYRYDITNNLNEYGYNVITPIEINA